MGRIGSDDLLERGRVLRAIDEVVAGSNAGRGGSLFIVAGPGLGKTTCLDRSRLRAGGARIGAARGDPMETGVPFGVLVELLRAVRAPPALAHGAAPPSGLDPHGVRVHRVLRWLEEEAGEPLLLVVDDLHWADPDSLAALSFLSRRIPKLPVGVIAALRPWPSAALDMAIRLHETGHAKVESLQPLSAEGSAKLLRARTAAPLPDHVVERATSIAAGNPLLLEQIALAHRAGDTALERVETWAAGAARSLLLSRFSGLPEVATRSLEAASVLGNRFRLDTAAEIAGLDDREMGLAFDAVTRSEVIRPAGGDLVEFAHPLFWQALHERLAPSMRQLLHARAFRALRRRGRDYEAAPHAVAAGLVGDAEAVAVLRRAAREAERLRAPATAAEHLLAAVDLAGSQPPADLVLAAGEALLATGRSKEAVRSFERVTGEGGAACADRVRALRMMGRALYMAGELRRAAEMLAQAVREGQADAEAAEELAQALLDRCRLAWLTDGPRAALPLAERAREASIGSGDEIARRAGAAWGLIAFVSGGSEGYEAIAEAERVAEAAPARDVGELWWGWDARRNFGRVAKFAERFDRAQEVIELALAAAERDGSPQAVASLAAHHADTLVRLGRLDEALAYALRAASLADVAPMSQPFAEAARAHVLLLLGARDEAEEVLASAEASTVRTGQWLPRLRLWHLRGQLLLAEGSVAGACALYCRLESTAKELGVLEPCVVPWARQAGVAYARAGLPDGAGRLVRWLESSSSALPCRWPAAAAASVQAHVEDAAGNLDAANQRFLAAQRHLDGIPLPLERIQIVIEHGAFLRRRGRRREARARLAPAMRTATDLGASWLAERARGELVISGGRPGRAHPAPDALTPQERRVAELAARGMPNRGIAGRLSTSERTVEVHLTRIFAKLGIRSRRELVGRLPEVELTGRARSALDVRGGAPGRWEGEPGRGYRAWQRG